MDKINTEVLQVARSPDLSFTGDTEILATPYRLNDFPSTDTREVQIFLHIPKCGGTTLHFMMACCPYYRHRKYTRFTVRDFNPPVFLRSGWTGAWGEMARTPQDELRCLSYLSGHFPFGVDTLLQQPARYVTLIRDPAVREVSSYNHHYQKGFINGQIPLARFIEEGVILDNPQVRMLAGRNAMSGECTEATYQTAISNLAGRFTLAGTVEDADSFLRALITINGWPPVAYSHAQVSGIKAIKSISQELTNLLYRYNAFDRRLHQHVTKTWRQWKQQWIIGEQKLSDNDVVIRLPPDIHRTKRPELVNYGQLGCIQTSL